MKNMKYILISIICIFLTGCAEPSQQEIEQAKIVACFSNVDLRNCDRIDFISYKQDEESNEMKRMRFSNLCRHKDINTILYRRYDYYESVYRTYKDIALHAEDYQMSEVMQTEEDITTNGQHHYIQIRFEDTISLTLGNDVQDSVCKILYDADTGDFWLSSKDQYTAVYRRSDEFSADETMLYYIEGEAPFREYKTFIEEIYYKYLS